MVFGSCGAPAKPKQLQRYYRPSFLYYDIVRSVMHLRRRAVYKQPPLISRPPSPFVLGSCCSREKDLHKPVGHIKSKPGGLALAYAESIAQSVPVFVGAIVGLIFCRPPRFCWLLSVATCSCIQVYKGMSIRIEIVTARWVIC